LAAGVAATHARITHDDDDEGVPYRHLQRLTLADLTVTVARGWSPGAGLEVMASLRGVRDRIRYETPGGAPYVPHDPDLHHRNETRVGLGDPQIAVHLARQGLGWDLAFRAGASLPLGRTEDNPFAAGRDGVRHQHVQFGTGTVDPILRLDAARPLGRGRIDLEGFARLVVDENARGYQAGHRVHLGGGFGADVAGTHVRAGVRLAREQAEHWDGRLETEGNLGRTDLLAGVRLGRATAAGTVALDVQWTLWTRSHGDQIEPSLVFGIGWSR
jgi:hypothetical protein